MLEINGCNGVETAKKVFFLFFKCLLLLHLSKISLVEHILSFFGCHLFEFVLSTHLTHLYNGILSYLASCENLLRVKPYHIDHQDSGPLSLLKFPTLADTEK